MANCCICQFNVRNPKDIYSETIGNPPILLSEVILKCTRGTDYQIPKDTSICKKCSEKLIRYHKSAVMAKTTRMEILELIRSPYIIEEFRASCRENCEEETEFEMEHVEEVKEEQIVDKEAFEVNELENDDIIVQVENEELEVFEDKVEQESVHVDSNYEEEEHLYTEEYDMEYYEDSRSTSDIGDAKLIYEDYIKCQDCDETFPNKRKYNAHVKREHFPGYVCDQCGKTLHSYSGLVGHLQNHEPVKQFECTVCGERFSRKFRLKHHMAWHSGETPFQCDVCSKQFVHKVALYKHKMIHDNDTKRFECQVCTFKFRTRAHLDRHMRSHTGAKPFECPVCKKCFSQMYNMKAHLREHDNPGCNRRRRFRCTKCTHTFTNEQNYMDHTSRCTALNSSADAQ